MNIGYHFPSVIQFHRQLDFMVPEPNFKLGHGLFGLARFRFNEVRINEVPL